MGLAVATPFSATLPDKLALVFDVNAMLTSGLSYLSWASSPSQLSPRSSFRGKVAVAPAAVPAPTSSLARHPANQSGDILLPVKEPGFSIFPYQFFPNL